MTGWEVLGFEEVFDGTSRKKTRRAHNRLVTRFAACGIALSLLFPALHVSGVMANTPAALGIFSQGIGFDNLLQDARPNVSYALSYTSGAGFTFDKVEDALIRVHVDGATVITQAQMPRLKQVLDDASINLGARDRAQVMITLNGQGGESMPEISVTRVRTKLAYEQEEIPFTVTRVDDAFLPPGKSEVRSAGKPGVLLKKFEVTTENDEEVARREVGSEVLQEAAPKLVAYGIKTDADERKAARGNGEQVLKTVRAEATAYTHTGNQTASGVWPYVGGVAVDPKVIPLGSKLYIEGYGPARAVDTGGLIKGNRIDLFFDSESEARAWGRRPVTVSVMR